MRLPAVAGRPGALYFTLEGGERGRTLRGIASPAAERIELHETVTEDGRMTMRPLGAVRAGPREAVLFAPGGRHAMLFGLDPALEPGARLRLIFDLGRPFPSDAVIVGPAGSAPRGCQAAEASHSPHR